MMSPKIGRPKVEMPLDIELKTRIDAETHKRLVEYCKEHHTTRAEVIRELIDKLLQENEEKNNGNS